MVLKQERMELSPWKQIKLQLGKPGGTGVSLLSGGEAGLSPPPASLHIGEFVSIFASPGPKSQFLKLRGIN